MSKVLSLLVTITILFSLSAYGAINVKGGLAGGAGKISGELTRVLNDKTDLKGEIGFGIGNNYTVILLGGSVVYKFKTEKDAWNPFVGLEINYSDFSKKAVDVPVVGTISKGGGVGIGLLAGLSRVNTFLQVGYNTRLGLVAEAGYQIRD